MASKKPTPVTTPPPSSASAAFWANPGDLDALRVWADALSEAGEPRGEFIQMCLTPNRTEDEMQKINALLKKLGGKLVGPARPYLRLYGFAPTGLLEWATTEASNFIEGFELISQLNPRLTANVTSLRKTKATLSEFAKLPLHRIFDLRLDNNSLTDDMLVDLAPTLRGVKRLSLAHNDVSKSGLLSAAAYLDGLEYLGIGLNRKMIDAGQDVAIGNGLLEAILESPQLQNLRVLYLGGFKPSEALLGAVSALPKLKKVIGFMMPPHTADIDNA